jgi:hypothetical protein
MKTIKNRILHLAIIIGLSAVFCGCRTEEKKVEAVTSKPPEPETKIWQKIIDAKVGDTMVVFCFDQCQRVEVWNNWPKKGLIRIHNIEPNLEIGISVALLPYSRMNEITIRDFDYTVFKKKR